MQFVNHTAPLMHNSVEYDHKNKMHKVTFRSEQSSDGYHYNFCIIHKRIRGMMESWRFTPHVHQAAASRAEKLRWKCKKPAVYIKVDIDTGDITICFFCLRILKLHPTMLVFWRQRLKYLDGKMKIELMETRGRSEPKMLQKTPTAQTLSACRTVCFYVGPP